MLTVGADQQEILRYWTKYAFLRITYCLSIFSLGCIKTLWGDVQSLNLTWMKHLVFVCRYAEPFRSYALPIVGGSSAKFEVFPAKVFRGEVKEIRRYVSRHTHQTCVQISWQSVRGRLRSIV